MKKINNILALLLAVVMSSCQQHNSTVNADLFEQKIQAAHTILIDVRTPEEFASGHLKGAVNINFYDKNVEVLFKQLPTNHTLLVYCKSGNRSRKAVQMLEASGNKNVIELAGGITAWMQAGKPIVQF